MRDKSSLVSGKGYSGINEEIIWISIGMGITIAILITIALCYIAREKCRKRHEGYYTSWRMFPPPSWASWSFSPTTPGILFSPTLSRGKPRAYYITVWILSRLSYQGGTALETASKISSGIWMNIEEKWIVSSTLAYRSYVALKNKNKFFHQENPEIMTKISDSISTLKGSYLKKKNEIERIKRIF